MEDELELPSEIDAALRPGLVSVDQVLGSRLAHEDVVRRVNHYFRDTDLGYKSRSGDTFLLRVRSRKYPVFGRFVGEVHVIQDLKHPQTYKIQSLLRFRISLLWFLSSLGFFFLLIKILHSGLWFGVGIQTIGSAIAIITSYKLGRGEAQEVDERVHAAFLRLRSTIDRIR